MKLYILILAVILTSTVQFCSAQTIRKYSYSLGVEVFEGIILRHHSYLGHLIKDRPAGLELSFHKSTFGGKPREATYGYPTIIYNLSYYDLKNKEQLGFVAAASTGMAFHLLGKPLLKNELQFYFGIGLAYANKPYIHDSNNLNNVISSPITFNGNLKFSYLHQFGNRWKVSGGVRFTHFSNGSMTLPNNGLNIVSGNLMTSFQLNESKPEYVGVDNKLSFDRKIHIGALIRLGWSESPPIS